MSPPRLILVFLGLCLTTGLLPAAPPATQILPIVMKRPHQAYQRFQRPLPAQPTVTVRSSMSKLVLEQKQGKGWKTVSTQTLSFAGPEVSKTVNITLPPRVPLSHLRVVAHNKPAEVARVAKIYEYAEYGGYYHNWNYGVLVTNGNLALTTNNLMTDTANATLRANINTVVTAPAAVESDIWQMAGNRLFFFNQFRGLQVVDMSHPEAPVRTGGVRLAARGDQMYVLDEAGTSVVLIGKSQEQATMGKPALFFLRVTAGGVPELLQEIPLEKNVIDSRLIGKKLYLLLRENSLMAAPQIMLDPQFIKEASLETFDVTNPSAPVWLSKLDLEDGSALQATGRYLLIGTGALGLHLIDTETASGAPVLVKTFPLKGAVQDKFKMGIVDGAVVAVTKVDSDTWVETYPLAGTDTAPLARIELVGARNESLHATRFDGDRVYVVTFRQIDPLFVVDLADPAEPVVKGILEIPGWSTYLQPMGDRLLAVGLENGYPTVSLFDVADPRAPSLLSRLKLGNGRHTHSEATWDEKAVEFFPEEGLVLVPFSEWTGNQYRNVVQAIEIGRDTLTQGMAIPHKVTARRGAVVGDHLVSISGQELVVMNRTESQEEPEAVMTLSWRVDYVAPFGNYLVQVEDGSGPDYQWLEGQRAKLRVSHRHDPDALVEELLLGAGPVVGMAQKGQRLFVAQRVQDAEVVGHWKLRTWILDMSTPPALAQVTTVEHSLEQRYTSKVEANWVSDTTLVWYAPLRPREDNDLRGTIGVTAQPIFVIDSRNTIGTTITNGRLLTGTLTLNNDSSRTAAGTSSTAVPLDPPPAAPVIVSLVCPIANATTLTPTAAAVIDIGSEKAFRCGERAFTGNGCLFASYEESLSYDGFQLMDGTWYRKVRPWMQVIDFNANPPLVRAAASIQGELLNVTQVTNEGALLFTHRNEMLEGNARQAVHALTYDGVAAYELDAEALTLTSMSGEAVDGHRFYFIQKNLLSTGPRGVTGLIFDVETNSFASLGLWQTAGYPTRLKAVNGYLLAGSYSGLEVATLNASGIPVPSAIFDHWYNLLLGVDRLVPSPDGVMMPALDYGVEFLPWSALGKK
ncbi:MAG TPA: beta-propeller domain-containing protein [Prosthecobacter sp.]|nr:beta-propeller domain-containing protein [Prosthecobacter sp.]